VKKLYAVVTKVMADPAVIKRLGADGAEVITSKSPEAFAAFMKAQTDHFAKLVKQVGAVAE